MPLLVVGISHHTAPLESRERLAIAQGSYEDKVREICTHEGISEAVIVSTCNRTEAYVNVGTGALEVPAHWLAAQGGLDPKESSTLLYTLTGDKAVNHLFQVACGLDSMVLGEPQILGQLKQSWQAAKQAGCAGKLTDRLFQNAFAVSKSVRSSTGINEHPVSVAYITAILARQIFGDLASKSVLMVGAGEMITLCAQHFRQQGVNRMMIANRSLARARELAGQFDAEPLPLSDLEQRLGGADIVISSTSSPVPVISQGTVKAAVKQRRHSPVFMVDLGVPRDIDPESGKLNDVYLYTIDDLRQVADEGLAKRRLAAKEAEETIAQGVQEFLRWQNSASAADGLRRLRESAQHNGDQLVAKALHQIQAGADPEKALKQLSTTLTNRILHGPSTRLREAAEQQHEDILKAAQWLFDEPGDEEGGSS